MKATLASTCAHLGNAGVTCMLIWVSYVKTGAGGQSSARCDRLRARDSIRDDKRSLPLLCRCVRVSLRMGENKTKQTKKKAQQIVLQDWLLPSACGS